MLKTQICCCYLLVGLFLFGFYLFFVWCLLGSQWNLNVSF